MCKQSQTARHVFVKLKEVQCKKETENVDLQNKSCLNSKETAFPLKANILCLQFTFNGEFTLKLFHYSWKIGEAPFVILDNLGNPKKNPHFWPKRSLVSDFGGP